MEQNEQKNSEFVNTLLDATIHFFYQIVYFLFIVPFDMWRNAVVRLAQQKNKGALKLAKIDGLWPLFSYLKVLLFEFLFDAVIFISYIIGLLIAIVGLVSDAGFWGFIVGIITGYYVIPIFTTFTRDFTQIFLLIFSKFISWCRKPAQQLDIDFKNRD